jgi:hypothetical protein
MKKEKIEFEDKMRKENEEEMRRLERQHEQQIEDERRKADAKLEARRQQLLKEQEDERKRRIEAAGALDAKRKRQMMEQIAQDQQRVIAVLAAERDRQQRALEDKLRVRRMRRKIRLDEKLKQQMEEEKKRLRQRIHAVKKSVNNVAETAKVAFLEGRTEGNLFRGEKSSVEMAISASFGRKWNAMAKKKHAAREAKKAALSPRDRRADRAARRDFWSRTELTAEEKAAREQRHLDEVERMQKKMEQELQEQRGAMSDAARKRRARLNAKIAAKKKRQQEKLRKLREEAKEQTAQSEAPNAGTVAETKMEETASMPSVSNMQMPTMSVPAAAAPAQDPSQNYATTLGGGFAVAGVAMDPEKEKIMFSKLQEIETLLKAMQSRSAAISGSPSASAAAADFLADDKEAHYEPEGKLRDVEPTKLDRQIQTRHAYSTSILKLLGMDKGKLKVEIFPAKSLPKNSYGANAFRNSFYWDAKTRHLYVRQERMENVGDYILLLVHALAHIKANPADLGNDLDPKFMKEFYVSLKLLGMSLFQSSRQVEDLRNSVQADGDSSSQGRKRSTRDLLRRQDDFFSHAALHERVARYKAFENNPDVAHFLHSLEGGKHGDFVDTFVDSPRAEAANVVDLDFEKILNSKITELKDNLKALEGKLADQKSVLMRSRKAKAALEQSLNDEQAKKTPDANKRKILRDQLHEADTKVHDVEDSVDAMEKECQSMKEIIAAKQQSLKNLVAH